MKLKSYNELKKLGSFEERFNYLRLNYRIGNITFGYDRYLNQLLYRSRKWKQIRDEIIIRDEGCDLGCLDFPITDTVIIHHINPVSIEDLEEGNENIFDPNFLITTSVRTHRAIHYSDESLLPKPLIVRYSGDTIPWR